MAYDLLIKNGRIVDGSGMPAFQGDLGVKDGKIVEIGKLSGAGDQDHRCRRPGRGARALSTITAITTRRSPGTRCARSRATMAHHGRLWQLLAGIGAGRQGTAKRVAEFLSYVEAIPMEVLNTVEVDWETIPQYMDRLDQNLGVNVGNLIGHSTVRYYVMGDEAQGRAASDDEIKKMQDVVRDGIKGGALGLSVSRNKGHYDPQGVHIPALWADEKEIFALGDVLREMGTGIIQSGGGRDAEMNDGLMARLAEATGRTVIYNNLGQTVREPDAWRTPYGAGQGDLEGRHPRLSAVLAEHGSPRPSHANMPDLSRLADLAPDPLASDEEKLKAYADPAVRQKLHEEMVEWKSNVPAAGYSREWYNYMWVETPVLDKNQGLKGKTIGQIAKEQNKRVIDAFLDLVVEENLDTGLMQSENNVDDEAMAKILTYPNAIVGLSDGGAHVQFHGGYGYSTRLLSEWVREKQVMTLEHAVRRLTFDSASALGLYDRGLLRPGMAADIVMFDPDTVKPLPESVVHDFPAGGWRMKEPAQGIMATIVNGQVLMKTASTPALCPAGCCATPTTRRTTPSSAG